MVNPARIAAAHPEASDTNNPIYAVGIGPGDTKFHTTKGRLRIANADVVVGFETVTDRVATLTDADVLPCSYDNQTEVLEQFAERTAAGAAGVAVLWGDPNVSGYQFLGRVENAVDRPVEVIPGISSIQIAASRARIPFEHSTFASLHRRGDVEAELDRLASTADTRHLLVIVRPYDWMPPAIAAGLLERGAAPESKALVLEELTLPNEKITRTTLEALQNEDTGSFSDRSILVVRGPVD